MLIVRKSPLTSTGFSPDRSLTYWNHSAWLVRLTIWVTSGLTTLGANVADARSAACGTTGPIGIRGIPMKAARVLTNGCETGFPAGYR